MGNFQLLNSHRRCQQVGFASKQRKYWHKKTSEVFQMDQQLLSASVDEEQAANQNAGLLQTTLPTMQLNHQQFQ